jgi:DNA-binding transcriptional regulator YdaS (Cro superfamily)
MSWTRLHDILGKSVVPPESAVVIERAVEIAVRRGDVAPNARWQLVEFWAANYLAGVSLEELDAQLAEEDRVIHGRKRQRRGTVSES